MDSLRPNAEAKQAFRKRGHERRRPAEIEVIVVEGELGLQEGQIDPPGDIVIATKHVAGQGLIIGSHERQVAVPGALVEHVAPEGVIGAVARAVEEPESLLRAATTVVDQDPVDHGDHRRDADARRQQNRRPGGALVENECAAGRQELNDVTDRQPMHSLGKPPLPFDADAEARPVGSLGNRIGAHFQRALDREANENVLSSLVGRNAAAGLGL